MVELKDNSASGKAARCKVQSVGCKGGENSNDIRDNKQTKSLQVIGYSLEVIGEENEQTKEKIDENNNKINNIVESHRV